MEMTHANVTVHDEADTEVPAEEGCRRVRRDEGDCGERDEACREEVLEGPLVRAVRLGRWREGRRVARRALVNR